MLKKALRPTALAAIMALPLAGCLSLGAEPPPSLLTLTSASPIPAGASTTGPASSALAVLEPATEQRLNVTRVPVQTSDSSLAYLKEAVWVEKPARLFQNLVAETIRARGNRLVVREGDLGYNAVTTLSGRLVGREAGDRARQAQPDDAAHLVRIGRGEAGFGETFGHRCADRRLAVAERAVAVEHGELDGHAASRRISAASAGEPLASSAAATRSRSSGGLFCDSLKVGRQARTSISKPTMPLASLFQ